MPLEQVQMDYVTKTTPLERRFSPYDFNGGTTVVIAGDDYAIAAGCTRMSSGYEILSRDQKKLFELSDKTVLATAGCQTDVVTLRRMLSARLTQYEHGNNKVMSTSAAAQLLSVTLYYRRFFPYYSFCLMAGLDEEGRGACYGYDAIGSFKRDDYGAMGSGQNFIMPLLDNLLGHKNRNDPRHRLSAEEAVAIVKDVFVTVTERDIHTGDAVQIKVIRKSGITTEIFQLKQD
jgi:20S proteasome subunit beta 6